ncbi:MAG: hypothetical protein IJ099_05760 [Alphaproteobacteria bacterium]|nr:hypothetical protein [Alphaproteobacteria bacterium]
MRFAVSLVRLLCGILAGVLLVAYLYFSINYEQTGVAGSNAISAVCFFLFVAALLIWGGLTVMSDIWLKRMENNQFYQNLLQQGQGYDVLTAAMPTDSENRYNDLLNQINTANEDSKQTLLNGLENLNEKLAALKDKSYESKEDTQSSLVDTVHLISQNMSEIQTQIGTLLEQLQQQKKFLTQLTDYPAKMNDGETKFYPILQEEAGYPESVIDYNKQNFAKNIVAEEKAQPAENFDKSIMDNEISKDTNNEINLEDEFVDEPLEDLLSEEDELSGEKINLDNFTGFPQTDLSASTVNLNDTVPEFTSAFDAEPEKVDLGADNQFAMDEKTDFTLPDVDESLNVENVDLEADNQFGKVNDSHNELKNAESDFKPSVNTVNLDADNPFGDTINLNETVDVNAIEPAANAKKNEPNLEQIFNDELASELADLEILNGKPTAKTQDDIDLEQFFAGHRKAIDQR